MSYSDYLRRQVINTPKVIDTQMRLPDASSFTWRTKLGATRENNRSVHVINNTFDPSSTPYNRRQVQSFPGSGFGGKVPDASSHTLSLGARSIGQDNFSGGRIVTNTLNAVEGCLTRPPASQVVSEYGNAEGRIAGLNMGYTRQRRGSGDNFVDNIGVCTAQFRPLTKSHFVDRIPDLKTRKIGTQSIDPGDSLGRQIVQNTIDCRITDTVVGKSDVVDSNGINLPVEKHVIPYNSYSPSPKNTVGSPENLVNRGFITGIQGPQTGGGNTPGSRAPIVGGVSVKPKASINHRGQATHTGIRYPRPYIPPTGAPARLRLNGPIFGTKEPRV
jgi:hypothetical protein